MDKLKEITMKSMTAIEKGARALCRRRVMSNFRFDTTVRDQDFFDRCVDTGWKDFITEAEIVIQAILLDQEELANIINEHYPTEMLSCGEICAKHILQYMIDGENDHE